MQVIHPSQSFLEEADCHYRRTGQLVIGDERGGLRTDQVGVPANLRAREVKSGAVAMAAPPSVYWLELHLLRAPMKSLTDVATRHHQTSTL